MMKITKTIFASMAITTVLSISANAQCPSPPNQILLNGDFECNDYTQTSEEYQNYGVLNGLFSNSDKQIFDGGYPIQDLNETLPVTPPSMHGWYRKSQVLPGGTNPEIHAWGEYGETGSFAAPGGESKAIIHSGTIIYRATDISKPLDPTKTYRISAQVREDCSINCDNESFTLTRNRQNFNFGMTKVTSSNANNGPLSVIENANSIALPGALNVQNGSNGWFNIQTELFQVSSGGQYWLSAGYFDYNYSSLVFSAKMHIDNILLEEVCPGTPAQVELSKVAQTPCPSGVSGTCSMSNSDGYVFITYQTDAAGNISGPAYTTNWFPGNLNGSINFANQTYTPIVSGDPAFPGFQVGNYYGVKVGTGNCSGIWADDAAIVQVKSASAYFYPTSTNSSNQALLHVGNYGGIVVDWEVSLNNGPWNSLNLGSADQITVTVPADNSRYRAVLNCNGAIYYSNMRKLNLYVPIGGGGKQKSLSSVQLETSVYPNPAHSFVTIEMESPSSITVHDAVGKTIWIEEQSDASVVKIDISDWQSGVYFVRLNDQSETIHFIKE